MNLLFDFITLQSKTGAAEYIRSVFFALQDEIRINQHKNINIFALYNSSLGIAYDDMKEQSISKNFANVKYVDIQKKDICSIIKEKKIDRFFIGCAQYLSDIKGIEKISCETFCVIHDMVDEEVYKNGLDIYLEMLNPVFGLAKKIQTFKGFLQYNKATLSFLKFFQFIRKRNWKESSRIQYIITQHTNNPKFHIFTVSEYSKISIVFNSHIEAEKIKVLFPIERSYHNSSPTSEHIKKSIGHNKKVYLLLNANRSLKNPYNTIVAFKEFAKTHPNCFLATIGYSQKQFENHIVLPFLNDKDLESITKQCYALIYPSFFEGFGYPPVEAMKFGKPILASNTTSLPEILGDAAIFFSPLYPSSIYKALLDLSDEKYTFYTEKSLERYSLIKQKSQNDLETLLNYLINEKNE